MALPRLSNLETQIREALSASGDLSIREIQEKFPAKKWPVYAPLKVKFDADRFRHEILGTESHWKSLAPDRYFAGEPKFFRVAPQNYYDDCEYVDSADGHKFRSGRNTWRGISLRHDPGNAATKLGSNRYRLTSGHWQWDSTYDIPYVREIVQSLPYETLEVVRVMSIDPPGFGPAHVDWPDDKIWEERDLVSTTFTIDYGGVHMQAKYEGKIFQTDAPVFLFKDSVPHGVSPVTHRRIILRVHGKADPSRYLPLIDTENSIW